MNPNIKMIEVIALTDKGGVAKTLVLKTLANIYDQMGVTWRALDFDAAHQGLLRAFPAKTELVSLESTSEKEGEFMRILRRMEPDHDVTLIDLQAHASRVCRQTIVKIDHVRTAYEKGIQVVCLLFPTSDPTDINRINEDVAALRDTPVKFVAVENVRNVAGGNTRLGFSAWRGSPAGKLIAETGATIRIPAIISVVNQAMVYANTKARRELTINELIEPGSGHLPFEYQGVLEMDFFRPIWAQVARNADFFLPPALAGEILASLPPEPEEKHVSSSMYDCINLDGLEE